MACVRVTEGMYMAMGVLKYMIQLLMAWNGVHASAAHAGLNDHVRQHHDVRALPRGLLDDGCNGSELLR